MQSSDYLSGTGLYDDRPEDRELEQVREAALRILDYADNSSGELTRKLLKKGYEREKIDRIVADLERADLINDLRFAESYTRMKLEAGKGPLWIRKKLAEKGIRGSTAEIALESIDDGESERIRCLRKALQILNMKGLYGIAEDGALYLFDESLERDACGSVFLRHCPEDSDRRERYRFREKEKARLIRRLASSGFSSGAVRHAVQILDNL